MESRNEPSEFTDRVVAILRARADDLGLSYRALADRSGVSKSKLQAVFTGERDILLPDLDAVADALGLVGWQVVKAASEPAREAGTPVLSVVEDTVEGPDESLLAADTSEEETEQ